MTNIELPCRGFSHFYHLSPTCPSEQTEAVTFCLLNDVWKRVHGDAETWVCMKADNKFIDPSLFTDRLVNIVSSWSITEGLTTIGDNGEMLATDTLKNRTSGVMIPDGVFNSVVYAYAEENGYDGVWWELPVSDQSVPYGIIVSSRLNEWNFYSSK